MTQDQLDIFHDNIPAYALGALDADDARDQITALSVLGNANNALRLLKGSNFHSPTSLPRGITINLYFSLSMPRRSLSIKVNNHFADCSRIL